MNNRTTWLVAPLLAFACLVARADDDPADTTPAKGPAKPSKGAVMDYGPAFASSIAQPIKGKQHLLAYKGVTIRLGHDTYVTFDTDLLRYAAGWTGAWLDLKKTHMTSSKGSICPDIAGKVDFTSAMGPGVSHSGSLADPRDNPMYPKRGPLPKDHAHYRGLYQNGDRVVLSYSVGAASVLEFPGAAQVGGATVFTRTFRIDKTTEPLTFILADVADSLSAALVNAPPGAKIETADKSLRLTLPALAQPVVFAVALAQGDASKLAASLASPIDPATLITGGPAHWKTAVETHGQLAKPSAKPDAFPYVVDTLALPDDNPWSAWMRITAFDFFEDGKSAAACTWNGDVWIVSGIDDSLAHLTWRRVATGLYEPLGLKIVKGQVYALGRDQITRLVDLNGDGETDFYENFNNDGLTGDQYHLFKFDLDTDPDGNFYYIIGGNWATNDLFYGHSAVCKVTPDGGTLEYVARGFRAPNGMAVGPHGEIVAGDNQGHWTPASKINYIPPGKTGGFYGHPFDPRVEKGFDLKKFYPDGMPKTYEPPLCWIPYAQDNSSGGQVFVTSDKWGPFKDHIVHTSYGKSALFMVDHEVLPGGIAQGGVWRFPLAFEAGIMRARFNPADGQLYVSGMRGWQTNSAKDACLQRVRYTGGVVRQPVELHAKPGAISITFATPLDPATANDVNNYDVEQWAYQWTSTYGSPEFSVENPTKKGHDTVDVKSAKLQPDGKTIVLEIPALAPVMQMGITYKLKGADGHEVSGALYNTINKL